MTIASQISKSGPFACNGVTTVFPGGFALIDAGHVSVILTNPAGAETVLTLGTHYSVSGVGGPTFSVTISPARPAGYSVTLIRNVPFTQETDLESQGAYLAEVVEAAFDAAVARDQQLKELIDRSVKIPASADIADLDSLVADIVQLGDRTEAIEAVAAIAPNVTTVAGLAGAVTTVAGIAPAVSTVGAASSQVLAVAANLSTISAVAANATNINAASGHAAAAALSAAAASASAVASAASAATTTPVPVQINAATDTAFADADMLAARKASDGSLIKRSWGNVKTALGTMFLSYTSPQALTAAQAGQARANIGADVLGGYRNKIINGDFDFWQRGTTQTTTLYGSDDRWTNENNVTTKTHSRQTFALGQIDVPGNPIYFSRTIVSSVANANALAVKSQSIESVQTLSGQTATLTFYAKADAPKSIAVEIVQYFGTGGSPSATVSIAVQLCTLTTTWQRFSLVVMLPSVAGKTTGTNNDNKLQVFFWMDAGSSFNARAANLGQQSGTFDFAHISFVEGDAMAEPDPFSPRHFQQELALCQRYYEKSYELDVAIAATTVIGSAYVNGGTTTSSQKALTVEFKIPKRVTPSVSFWDRTGLAGKLTTVDAAGGQTNNVTPASSALIIGQNAFNFYHISTAPGFAFNWAASAEL